MSNVLFSRDKLTALIQVAYAHHQHYIMADLPSSAKAVMDVITMPDFVESAEDVNYVANAIRENQCLNPRLTSSHDDAQAAINALRYNGGE